MLSVAISGSAVLEVELEVHTLAEVFLSLVEWLDVCLGAEFVTF